MMYFHCSVFSLFLVLPLLSCNQKEGDETQLDDFPEENSSEPESTAEPSAIDEPSSPEEPSDTEEPPMLGIDDVSVGDIIITEIMKDPSMVDGEFGEWFEIYNTTNEAVNIQGLVVVDEDDDAFVVDASVVIEGKGYLVLGASDDNSNNGGVGVDYDYDRTTFSLANGSDEVILQNSSISIDIVIYDNGDSFPDSDGYSLSLSGNKLSATANDDGSNWCNAEDTYGAGDYGSPGASNPTCPDYPDEDNDGFATDVDCNDDDSTINPGADDSTCDGIDNDCDGDIDEDWDADISEPNESSEAAYFLGFLGGDSSNGESAELTIDAYLYQANDVDAFYFYTEDEWNDAGFNVFVDSVSSIVDIAFAIDFVPAIDDGNGNPTPDWANIETDWRIENENSLGESESGCVGDIGFCLTTGYQTGFFVIRVYGGTGSDCSDAYTLTIED